MNAFYRQIIFISAFLLAGNTIMAQQSHFSQYYSAPLLLGPSFAGITFANRAILNYRDKFPDMPGDYMTLGISYDQYIPQIGAGIGFQMLRDNAPQGEVKLAEIGMSIAYDYEIIRGVHLRPGLQIKHIERHDDINNAKGTTDFAVSLLVFSSSVWVGSTVDHLLRPNQSLTGDFIETPIEISVYGGYKYWFESNQRKRKPKDPSFSVAALGMYQNGFRQADVGAFFQKFGVTIGAWFRYLHIPELFNADIDYLKTVVLTGGYTSEYLNLSYSYDLHLDKYEQFAGGPHEITLVYSFNLGDTNKKRGQVPCPSM